MALNTYGQEITKYGGSPVPTASKSVDVVRYQDNADGTTTNFLSDGTQDTGRYSPNSDGSLNFNSINSTSLNSPSTPNFKAPEYSSPYPVIGLGQDPYANTAQEGKASDLTTRLQELNDSLTGEASYRAELENQAGVSSTVDASGNRQVVSPALTDLNNQLTTLKNEAMGIQTYQAAKDPSLIGRGVTEGGARPLDLANTEKLRQNAIQALGVAARAEALKNNLQTSLTLVDRQVQQKYDPIKAEIKAKMDNLELILKDPAYTNAQKKKADAQLLLQKKQEAAIDREEQDFKDTQQMLVKIIGANQPDGATIQELQGAHSAIELAALASQKGMVVDTAGLPSSAQEYLFAKRNGYTGDFSAYQNEDANRKRSIAAAGVANSYGMSPGQVSVFNSVVDKYNKSPLVAANDRAVILKDVTSALEADPNNASLQVSFIYSMIQALDTYQSAVREGEIGLISSTQGLGDRLSNLPSKIQNGTPLSANKVAEYISTARVLTNSIANAATQKRQGFSAQANIAGIGAPFNDFVNAISGQPVTGGDPLQIGTGNNNPLGI